LDNNFNEDEMGRVWGKHATQQRSVCILDTFGKKSCRNAVCVDGYVIKGVEWIFVGYYVEQWIRALL